MHKLNLLALAVITLLPVAAYAEFRHCPDEKNRNTPKNSENQVAITTPNGVAICTQLFPVNESTKYIYNCIRSHLGSINRFVINGKNNTLKSEDQRALFVTFHKAKRSNRCIIYDRNSLF